MSKLLVTLREQYFPELSKKDADVKIGAMFGLEPSQCSNERTLERTVLSWLQSKKRMWHEQKELLRIVDGGEIRLIKYKTIVQLKDNGDFEIDSQVCLEVNNKIVEHKNLSEVERTLLDNFEAAFAGKTADSMEELSYNERIRLTVMSYIQLFPKDNHKLESCINVIKSWCPYESNYPKQQVEYVCKQWAAYLSEEKAKNTDSKYVKSLESFIRSGDHLHEIIPSDTLEINLYNLPVHRDALEIFKTITNEKNKNKNFGNSTEDNKAKKRRAGEKAASAAGAA